MTRMALIAAHSLAAAALAKPRIIAMDEMEQQTNTESEATSGLPERLSVEPDSAYFTAAGAYVGVRLNGEIVEQVVEYQAGAKGWVRKGEKGMTLAEAKAKPKIYGCVIPFWKMTPSRQVRRQLARVGR